MKEQRSSPENNAGKPFETRRKGRYRNAIFTEIETESFFRREADGEAKGVGLNPQFKPNSNFLLMQIIRDFRQKFSFGYDAR